MLEAILSCTSGKYLGRNMKISMLIERVWLVTSVRTSRMESFLYKFHLLLLIPYIGIFVLMVSVLTKIFQVNSSMILFRIGHLNSDATCMVGLQRLASIPLESANYCCLNNLSPHLCCKHLFVGVTKQWGKRFCLLGNVFVRRNVECDYSPLGT
ncbi:hypothetical protein BC938DRAFT_474256 [Jimgerdemannia flammicorona]|uniref:Uncharacterized protein n=1 Tax=Jimgerdemannia flammicorona TaxID=994334 RepID=A0A433Q2L7_9FUNG|nr:hypothetical protein BC938DRAFT_474256 [Jimgerdemannia flammicorona]